MLKFRLWLTRLALLLVAAADFIIFAKIAGLYAAGGWSAVYNFLAGAYLEGTGGDQVSFVVVRGSALLGIVTLIGALLALVVLVYVHQKISPRRC